MTKTISQEPVIIEHKNMVTWLRLNRPDRLNAVNAAMIEGLIDGLTAAIERGSNLVVFLVRAVPFRLDLTLAGLINKAMPTCYTGLFGSNNCCK